MAADAVPLTMLGGGSSGPSLPSGRPSPASSGGLSSASSPSPAASSSGTRNDGAGKKNSSGSQGARSSDDGSDASGAANHSSTAAGSKPSGKDGSARSGNSSGTSGTGRQGARSSGISKPGAAPAASQGSPTAGTAGSDFPAALAQSLAATPADDGATSDTPAATGTAKSNTGEQSEPTSRHSASDPVSSALTLLEQALAGALAGVQAAAAAATATPGTAGASTGGSSSQNTGTIGTSGKSSTAGLDALLTQNLAADGKAVGSNPPAANASSTAAASAASASTAAAGLTAATQLSSAAHLGSQQQGPAPSAMSLSSPVGTSAWNDELGTKVTWMAHQGIESASLQLSPEHLGPLQVSISVHGGQASVWFGAAQPDTRTALQQSLPHLRQLFASQGLTLADAGVSREPPRGQTQQQSSRSAPSVSGIAAVSLDRLDTRASSIGGLGLLDTYA